MSKPRKQNQPCPLPNWEWDDDENYPALVEESIELQVYVHPKTLVGHDEDADEPIMGPVVCVTRENGDELCQLPVVVLEALIATYRSNGS